MFDALRITSFDAEPPDSGGDGGCSTSGGGTGLVLGLALVGLVRRRRSA